ncbi:hypothetical protein HK104_010595 [Borealophlyctis nickersoniae]|nr:hypothetical protein HK104_010595 [Borealophlyctis nickersoniae]
MAPTPILLLGVLIGRHFVEAIFDHVWWSSFGADPSTLKSRVTAAQRNAAMNFYKANAAIPRTFLYVYLAFIALILIGHVGTIINKPRIRALNIMSLLCLLGSIAAHAVNWDVVPKFGPNVKLTVNDEAQLLYRIALCHAVSLAALVGAALCQIVAAEVEEEDVAVVRKKIKSK